MEVQRGHPDFAISADRRSLERAQGIARRTTPEEDDLDSPEGQVFLAELAEIMCVLHSQRFRLSPEIVKRLGSACEKLAELTDFSFAVDILEHEIQVGFLKFLNAQRDGGIVILNRFTEVDRMCYVLLQHLLGYFGNKVVEQNRLLAVPAGDTSNAVAEIMGSLHTP